MAFCSSTPSKKNVFETLLRQIPQSWPVCGRSDAESEFNRRITQKEFDQNLLKFERGVFKGC